METPVMAMKRRHFVVTAGALYLALSAFTGVILVRWSTSGVAEAVAFAQAQPQFIHTFVAVPVLAAVSIALALALLLRGPSRTVVVLSLVAAASGALWSLVALVLWLIPVPFVVGAYRT
jgi:hypothetical protein